MPTPSSLLPRVLGALLVTQLCCVRFAPAAQSDSSPIAVVHAEVSVRESDRGYIRSIARHLVRWLDDAGLPPAVFPDTQIRQALAPPRRVAHLVNIDQPTQAFLAEIDAFLGRGGKLVVYNSASQDLADRMGITIGPFRQAPQFGAWAQFRFTDPPSKAPQWVRQISGSLREVSPSGPETRVIAWWESRTGKRTPYPAWLRHPNGFWMTHLLLANEDGESRRKLLTAISGACDPSCWRTASDTLHARLGSTVGAEDYASAVSLLRARTPGPARTTVEEILRQAGALHAQVQQDRKRGRHAEATANLWQIRWLLTEAYGFLQPEWNHAIRAVWDHKGYGLFLGDWDATIETLVRYGITDLFLLVADGFTTHAEVPGLAESHLRRDHGDQLAAATAAARNHPIRIHAWIAVLSPMMSTRADVLNLAQPQQLLVHRDGHTQHWLDPRSPATRTRLARTTAHLARAYAVHGIHLDYIRYPDLPSGLGGGTRADFERGSGRVVPDWPEDVLRPSRSRHREFIDYRSRQITSLVEIAHRELRTARPEAKLSAAVFGRYPLCVDSVGQDWMAWLKTDSLDWAAPMNYSAWMERYRGFLDDQSVDPALKPRILSGIGVTAAECFLPATRVMDQIEEARIRGFGGYVLFDLDTTLRSEVLPFLRLGVNRP